MDELPATLSLALKPELELGGILAIAETDLLLDGSFGEEWLVLTAGRLRVFSAPAGAGAPAPTARLDLPTTDLARPQIEALIGGGALMADIKGRSFEILRFSNAQQRKFGRLGKYLADDYAYREAVAKNKTPLPDPAVLRRILRSAHAAPHAGSCFQKGRASARPASTKARSSFACSDISNPTGARH